MEQYTILSAMFSEVIEHLESQRRQYDLVARAQQGGSDCQVVGGKRIDQTVVEVFLEAMSPCAADAAQLANEEAQREGEALWAHQIERVAYQSQRTESSGWFELTKHTLSIQ